MKKPEPIYRNKFRWLEIYRENGPTPFKKSEEKNKQKKKNKKQKTKKTYNQTKTQNQIQ